MIERKLAVISAGLSQPSSTRLLADRLAQATVVDLASRGLDTTVTTFELRDHAHDIMNMMLTGFPSAELRKVLDALGEADGLIAVSPIFTTSYSGLFKSFVDVIENDALIGLPVLLGATGGTPRHSLAMDYAMRPMFSYLRADVVPTSVFAATADWARAGGDDELASRISRAGEELAARVALRPRAEAVDPFANAPSFDQLLRGEG